MSLVVATTRVACNTATGNQTITTTDLGGLTPKAAMFFVTQAVTDGTAADEAVLGLGAATGASNQWAVGWASRHNQATTSTWRRAMTDECALIISPVDGSVDGEANFSSFTANGVVITWGNAPAAAYLLTVVLFAGTDLSAYAGTFTQPNAVDATVNVTGVGFEPDLVFCATHGTTFGDAANGTSCFAFGLSTNKSPVVQVATLNTSHTGSADSSLYGSIRNDACYGQQWGTPPEWTGQINTFGADGFTATNKTGVSGGTDVVGYLALNFNGLAFQVGTLTTPTSTGDNSPAPLSFTPQFLLLGLTQAAALNTNYYTDGSVASIGVAAIDGDEAYCNSIQDENAQATTDTQSLSDDTAVNLPLHDGSAGHVASFVSFNSDGWTLNWSTVTGTAKQYWYLAIEAEAGAERSPVPGFCDMSNLGMY